MFVTTYAGRCQIWYCGPCRLTRWQVDGLDADLAEVCAVVRTVSGRRRRTRTAA